MEIKMDNRVVAGIAVIVTAIVVYQEYSEPEGMLYHLNTNTSQGQNWSPNTLPPNQSPYGPARQQPSPYGPANNNAYNNHPNGPNSSYRPTPNGPSGVYGPEGSYQQAPPNPYLSNQYAPQPNAQPPYGPQQGYGPNQGYGPQRGQEQIDYTSENYEVDLGQPTEPDGW